MTAVLAGMLGAGAPASASAPAGPSSRLSAPEGVEGLSPYVGQVSCDPVAKPGTSALAAMVLAHYKAGRNGGISRDCSVGGTSEHKDGRAWDWMLDAANPADAAVAESFLQWLTAPGPDGQPGYNARRLGVMYVIWNRSTWATYRSSPSWQPYTGANPHTDHIHISLSWSGAMGRTSWWTGQRSATDYGPCVPFAGWGAQPYAGPNHQKCPSPASTSPLPAGYYKAGYSPTIYEVTATGRRPVTYQQWAGAGFPAPRPTPTDYVRYPWSPAVYAVTFWPGAWQWDAVGYTQWQAAGFPGVRHAGWIDGSRIVRYGDTPELHLEGRDGSRHTLTHAEWQATGFRWFTVL